MKFARVILVVVVASVFLAGDASALDTMGRQEQGWTLGLGFGMGRAHVAYFSGDREESFREGVNTEWRLGKMLSPKLALTFDYQGWMIEGGDLTEVNARYRQGLQVWGPGLTWYPGNPANAWGGMYFRMSGGFALANLAETALTEDLEEDDERRLDEWGWAIGGSAGYEFFVTNTVGIGPAVNFSYLHIKEELADQGRWLTLTILGSWYF